MDSRATALYTSTGGASLRLALVDLWAGLRAWPLWLSLAWMDIRLRYRGSVLGPFWLTISLGAMILGLGLVYGQIFQIGDSQYLPYLAAGLVAWTLLATLTTEGCTSFASAEKFIKHIRQPLSLWVYRGVARSLIVLVHNLAILVLVLILFEQHQASTAWLALPGLLLLILNAIWVQLFLGIICVRFRDIIQIVASGTQIMFFVTPVLWKSAQISAHTWIVDANPFYHFIAIVRDPLLGAIPTAYSYGFVGGMTVAGWLLALIFFAKFRSRLAYWV